jgi:transposase InsO family protein
VSRSRYYVYQKQQLVEKRLERSRLVRQVQAIAKSYDHSYGSRRIAEELQSLGYKVGRYQAHSLMLEGKVKARYRRRYRITTDSEHGLPVFANLLARQFQVNAPNRVWASDITYLWTREGWLYLAVVIDLYSRKVVGWSMGNRLTSTLVCDALCQALWQRRPSQGQLLHHSDRGVQYASKTFRRLLQIHGITGSMSRKGNCWDNAVVESFFGSLKAERVFWRNYQTRHEARLDVLDYIGMFYNSRRRHSYLGYQSPDQFERQNILANVA